MARIESPLFQRVVDRLGDRPITRGKRALAEACQVLHAKLTLLRKVASREEPPILAVENELKPYAAKVESEVFSRVIDEAIHVLLEGVGFRPIQTVRSAADPAWLYARLSTFYRPAEELIFDHLIDDDSVLLFTTQEEHRFLTALMESRERLGAEQLFVWTLASGFMEPKNGRLTPMREPQLGVRRLPFAADLPEHLSYEGNELSFRCEYDQDKDAVLVVIADPQDVLSEEDLPKFLVMPEVREHLEPVLESMRRKLLLTEQPPVPALRFAQSIRQALNPTAPDAVYVFLDVHRELESGANGNLAENIRVVRDAYHQLQSQRGPRRLLLFGHDFGIPEDLLQEIPNVDLPLPTRGELTIAVTSVLQPVTKDKELIARAVEAVSGLTLQQSTSALQRIIRREDFVASELVDKLQSAKSQQLKSEGVLEVVRDIPSFHAGGLDRLSKWLDSRQRVFEHPDEAEKCGIDRRPKGLLLLGISGSGKSLAAKQVARDWQLPLLRFDAGAIYDKYLGSSEARLRRALKVAETIAPCVLWIDEIEKGFGSTNDNTGVSQRVLGSMLVWMQENTSAVFTVATANDITRMPPELTRAGRFDARFFLGCPGEKARREILEVHLQKRKYKPDELLLTTELVKATHGFTGAELEQVILDGLFAAFEEGVSLSARHLTAAIAQTRPLVSMLGRTLDQVWELIEHGRVELASSDTLGRKDVAQLIDPFRFSPMYCRLKQIEGYEKHAERAERMISSQPSFGSAVCVLKVDDAEWIYAQCNFSFDRNDGHAFKFLDRFATIETNDVFFMLCREHALESIIFETKELEQRFRDSPYLGELTHLFSTFGVTADATDATIDLLAQQTEAYLEQ